MSREDVDVVREVVALNNQAGLLDRGAIERLIAPDGEFHAALPDTPPFIGHEGLLAYHGHLRDSFGEWSAEVDEIVDAGDGRVLVAMTVRARGEGSGINVEGPRWALFEVRDGLVQGGRIYLQPSEAYAAAGLPAPDR